MVCGGPESFVVAAEGFVGDFEVGRRHAG